MKMMKTLKRIILLLCAIGVIWLPLDFLYSQTPTTTTEPPKTQEGTPTTLPTLKKSSITPSAKVRTSKPLQRGKQVKKTEAPLPPDLSINEQLNRPSLMTQAIVLTFLALFPFIIMILTSFLKIVVVLSLLRTALGVNQAPPNAIINGVAFMLSLYIMYPTGLAMYDAAEKVINQSNAPDTMLSKETAAYIFAIGTEVREPLREFLQKNTSVQHQRVFYRIAYKVLPEEHRDDLKPEDFIILTPAFITSQLKAAFEIGVLIYIPFFVIDLVTSNILLAMGMMMLSPVTISMPLKLFLLVMLDGWTILIEGLVTTFLH